ncbi:MAG: TauD/TfdA family dioxygenase [Alphaproteobacteria bacterium]|nr:MAG: TauD/TfdA family dioxygenase [Alphaproteobacteria bacterium]
MSPTVGRVFLPGSALGAWVTGIDLAAPIHEADFATLHAAILEHLVLVFPGQEMTEADHLRFSELWGTLPLRHRYGTRREKAVGHKSVMLVSNIREDGVPIGSLPDGEMMFHSDGSYDALPYKYTLLFAVEIPSVGGNTLFANMYTAFDTLSHELKARLADCHGRQLYYSGTMQKDQPAGEINGTAVHPLFIAHDETGRTAIYISRLITDAIVELPGGESDAVLARLFDHCERHELIYEHAWRPGDFLMWDNRCVTHGRRDFPRTERRLLRRTVVQGPAPRAAKAS